MSAHIDVLAGERDARTIYDIACIREEKHGASREDVEFKAIALRNYQFCAAVAELIGKADTAATVLSNPIAAGQVDAGYSGHVTDLTAALANVGGAK